MTRESDEQTRMTVSAPCKYCGRKFSRNDSLTRHLKVHGSHVERGPVHRIINEKFRACSNCRRAKVRCPGSTAGGACARCSQNRQQCTYDKSKTAQSSPKSATSPPAETVDGLLASKPSMPSPQNSSSEERAVQSPGPGTAPRGSVDMARQRSQDINGHAPSPPGSPPHPVQLETSSEADIRTTFLGGIKDLSASAISSTYVSPTLHILDPYSYKLPSIADSLDSPARSAPALGNYRYPVLQYLVPFLDLEFSSVLACDLLDTYFSTAFCSRMHPTCHHIHNFILRRCDVLDSANPRRMHPALLASMLFVAALSDKALSLFSGPEEKDRICKYLALLTYRLLNPSRHEPLLSHEDLGLPLHCDATLGWTNQELQQALQPQQHADSLPITWGTDYIITFIHVSSVISGSEKKAASIRWYVIHF
jgi:arabinolytic transcriptional activator AraR